MPAVSKHLINNTLKAYWISSGTTPSQISLGIRNGSETIVSSGAGVSSGGGHFYRFFSVDSPGYYSAEWRATIGGLLYRRKFTFKAVEREVD